MTTKEARVEKTASILWHTYGRERVKRMKVRDRIILNTSTKFKNKRKSERNSSWGQERLHYWGSDSEMALENEEGSLMENKEG